MNYRSNRLLIKHQWIKHKRIITGWIFVRKVDFWVTFPSRQNLTGGGTVMTLKFKFTSDGSADRLVLQNGYVMQHFKNKSAFVARCIDVEAPRCELWQLLLILDLFRLQSQRDQEIHSTISVSSSHRHDDSPALISNANSPPVELCVDLMPSQHEAAAHWLVAEDRSDTRRTSVCFSVEY